MADDGSGDSVNIPTIFIDKKIGEELEKAIN